MTTKSRLGALALFAFLSGALMAARPAAAQYLTGEELVRHCISENKQDNTACIYYITGVIDYHAVLQSLAIAPTIDFCLPSEIAKEQAAVLVLAYMRQHPQHDPFAAATVVPMALNKVFPCRKAAPKKKK
jgi:hypothetical protein